MKRFLGIVALITLMMASGTFIDWVVHSSHARLYVEPEYYLGKMEYGVLWGLFALWVLTSIVKVRSPRVLAMGIPAFIALFLQTKYFYQGRDNFFVFLFLFLHFFMFLPGAYWIFKKYPHVLIGQHQDGVVPEEPRWGRLVAVVVFMEILFYLYFTYYVGLVRF